MYDGDGSHYFRVGLSAIRRINEAVECADVTEVRSILDFPCGSGRVLRFLIHQFPGAEITACELDRGPVEFCERAFGVRPAYSSLNLDQVSLGNTFDLIWCGSLATHLDEQGIIKLVKLFRRHLTTGGLMMFTTHGDFVHRRIVDRDFDYGLTPEQSEQIGASYSQTGYGYGNYPQAEGYGVSLTSPEWIRDRVRQVGGLREVLFKECGWDDHQDTFGFILA
jgi:SAM-dependent methyltransferase